MTNHRTRLEQSSLNNQDNPEKRSCSKTVIICQKYRSHFFLEAFNRLTFVFIVEVQVIIVTVVL